MNRTGLSVNNSLSDDSLTALLSERAADYRQQATHAATQAADARQQAEDERGQVGQYTNQAAQYQSQAQVASTQADGFRSQAAEAKTQAANQHNQSEQAATNARYYAEQAARSTREGHSSDSAQALRTAEDYWSEANSHANAAADYEDKAKGYERVAHEHEQQAQSLQDSASQAEREASAHQSSAALYAQQSGQYESQRAGYEADAASKDTLVAAYEVQRGSHSTETIQPVEEPTMNQLNAAQPWQPTGAPREHMPNPEPEQVLDQGLALYGTDEEFRTAVQGFEQQINSMQSFDLNVDGKPETLVERFDRDHHDGPDAVRVISGDQELVVQQEADTTMGYLDRDGDHVVDAKFELPVAFDAPYSAAQVQQMLETAHQAFVRVNAHDAAFQTDFADTGLFE